MTKKVFTKEVFDGMIDKVVEWNKIGGNSAEDTTLIPIYTQLAREEMFSSNEFLQGWFNGDKVMQLDGICDLIFTAGFLSVLTDSEYVDESNDTPYTEESEIASLCDALIIKDMQGECLRPFLFIFCSVMSEHFDIEGAFEAIYASNLSKFVHVDKMSEAVVQIELDDIQSQGRYGDLSYKIVENYYVFLAGEDVREGKVFDKPKVIKPSTFFEPSGLEEFIY